MSTGLKELDGFDTRGSSELVVRRPGPDERRRRIDPQVVAEYPALSESLWRAASQQLRNMASLGGNLLQRTRCAYFRGGEPFACNKRKPGSGCAALQRASTVVMRCSAAAMLASPSIPATWRSPCRLRRQDGCPRPKRQRTIAVEELHREPGTTPDIETALEPGELILRIRVPGRRLGRASTYHKISDRESYAFALASAAVALQMDGDTVRDGTHRHWRARHPSMARPRGRAGARSASR